MILEPCCYRKQLTELIGSNRINEHLFTFGDTDLQMLMDFFVSHTPECDVYLVLVQVEEETLQTISSLMEAKRTSNGKPMVKSFVLLHQGNNKKAVHEALDKFRKDGRLMICESDVSFRCLCVGNGTNHFVLQGAIPQKKNFAMQMFSLSMGNEQYENVMRILNYRKKKHNS